MRIYQYTVTYIGENNIRSTTEVVCGVVKVDSGYKKICNGRFYSNSVFVSKTNFGWVATIASDYSIEGYFKMLLNSIVDSIMQDMSDYIETANKHIEFLEKIIIS